MRGLPCRAAWPFRCFRSIWGRGRRRPTQTNARGQQVNVCCSCVALGLIAALPLHAAAAPLLAQEADPQEAVAIRVLAVNGQLAQVDRGKEAGVEPGDRVRLRPFGGSERFGRVQSVAERTAWVVLVPGPAGENQVDIGTPGEIELPSRRRRDPEQDGSGFRDRSGALPESEPVWVSLPEADPDQPLLEQLGTRPEQRPEAWYGRLWSSAHLSAERAFRNSHSVFARSGIDLQGENLFGHGGALQLRMEFDFRSWDAEGESADHEAALRLERASYTRGGHRHETQRLEAGRFLQHGFPELGLLDGLELQWGRPDRTRFGMSAGWIPEATQELTTGNDFQLAAFYRDERGGGSLEATRLRWGAAMQQTWHDGQADRQLVLLQTDWIQRGFAWRNSAWLDVYDADDFGKDSGLEPTLAYSMLNWNQAEWGTSLGLRHWRYPSLLRFQAGRFPLLDLYADRTTRYDVSAWWKAQPGLRLRVRLDHWASRDRDGNGVELRADLDDFLAERLRTSVAVFQHDGSFTRVLGVRVDQNLPAWAGSWRMQAESARYDERYSGDASTEHEIRAHWFHRMSTGWSLSVDAGWRFGAEQNNPSLSLFCSRSF